MSKHFAILTCYIVVSVLKTFSQNPPHTRNSNSSVLIADIPADSLLFTKNWVYRWYIIKNNDGTFSSDEVAVTPADTAHRFCTASCQTDVQGGYKVRFCYASIKNGIIKLHFRDGAPAYSSEYNVFIKADSFYCTSHLLYPVERTGWKNICQTQTQKLALQQKQYQLGDTIKGYISFTFIEKDGLPGKQKVVDHHYFTGYFCTVVNTKEEIDLN